MHPGLRRTAVKVDQHKRLPERVCARQPIFTRRAACLMIAAVNQGFALSRLADEGAEPGGSGPRNASHDDTSAVLFRAVARGRNAGGVPQDVAASGEDGDVGSRAATNLSWYALVMESLLWTSVYPCV